MKVRKEDITMDLNTLIEHIMTAEQDVVTINCPKTVKEAGLSFERMQKSAGLIKDLTWDVTMQGKIPVIERKTGNIAHNFNYTIFSVELTSPEIAKTYVEDHGKKLINVLKKYKLGEYQCLAYRRDSRIYLMFNSVDSDGNQFAFMNDARMTLAFAGKPK